MKNKFLGGVAVLTVAAVAAWNVNFNSQKSDLSDVSLANVEALAQESNGYESVSCCSVRTWDPVSETHNESKKIDCNRYGYGCLSCNC